MTIQPHLYFIPLNNQLSRVQFEQGLALGWLTEDEINKVHRYKAELAQHNALQVRLALRAVLSNHSDVLPQQWLFEYGDKGKPSLSAELFERSGLHFNLSHSGDWLMIGVLPCANLSAKYVNNKAILFGLDIERVRASTNIQPILNHYFTDGEVADLVALPYVLQRQRFFDLWTLKEAYIKATGKGLAQSLSSFSFAFTDNNVFQADCFSVAKTASVAAFESAVVNTAERAPSAILCRHDDIHFTAPTTDNSQWTCRFGRLTDTYRFSFCIGVNTVLNEDNGIKRDNDNLAAGVNITEPIMVLTSLAQLL
ncbi:4'-phosphopantetheinyl transferase family protein [Shewanella sp. OMA3-2]|uniref:4'-phosphopantetheinyl transferase family protein n=1 Tax=Shewanella sp. OMA3-2 TaxID=2908650 RepID=UPI002342FCE0|nr:4'-phosphopantetheinyl transferase superfamily protein [Shewanella sp. OMA3-2]